MARGISDDGSTVNTNWRSTGVCRKKISIFVDDLVGRFRGRSFGRNEDGLSLVVCRQNVVVLIDELSIFIFADDRSIT